MSLTSVSSTSFRTRTDLGLARDRHLMSKSAKADLEWARARYP